MNPLMCPTSPAMAIVPPFSEIPALDDASPSITMRPPRADAPAHSEALPRTRTVPDIIDIIYNVIWGSILLSLVDWHLTVLVICWLLPYTVGAQYFYGRLRQPALNPISSFARRSNTHRLTFIGCREFYSPDPGGAARAPPPIQ